MSFFLPRRLPGLTAPLRAIATPTPLRTPVITNRYLSSSKSHVPRPTPAPIPFIPDVDTFLRVIGRDLQQYSDKIPSWEALFSLSSEQMRELGVEPARSRKYLLRWIEKYRNGLFGPGGDFAYVTDGKAKLVVQHDVVTDAKHVVNIPFDKSVDDASDVEKQRVAGYVVRGAATISGPYALPMDRAVAVVSVGDRIWEDRRGQKVDGGERRKVMTRFKKRIAERKAMREG